MSLTANLLSLVTRIGTEFKNVYSEIGDITTLTTTAKSSAVAAINELKTDLSGAGAVINDTTASGSTVYSSTKTNSQISAAVATETSRAETAEALLAPLASPTFTGTPLTPTAAGGTNTTQVSSTAFVHAAVAAIINDTASVTTTAYSSSKTDSQIAAATAALVASAPGTLNTLKELADAINDDASYAATITTALGTKAPLASPALTGTPTAPTPISSTNTTQLATTAFVQGLVALLATLASPTFTGTVTIPTVSGTSDSTTKAASTAFVQAVAALETTAVGDTTTDFVTAFNTALT